MPKVNEKDIPNLMLKIAGPENIRIGGIGLLVALATLGLTSGILVIFLALARRKIAMEKNKASILEEKLKQVSEQKKLTTNQKKREESLKIISKLLEDVIEKKSIILEQEKEAKRYAEKLDKVNDWEELHGED